MGAKTSKPQKKKQNKKKGPQEEEHRLDPEESKRRGHIAAEILSTEESFVEGMTTVVEAFVQPLSARGLISPQQIRALFSISEEIAGIHREQLLRELRARVGGGAWSDAACVGDVFVRACELLRIYSTYANNYGMALATLATLRANNAKFAAFLDEVRASNPRCKGQEVSSFMILPIQRIPRYVLLVQDLLRHTPDWHPDHAGLSEALEKLRDLAVAINEKKRESESQARMLQVEEEVSGQPQTLVAPHRAFVHEGDVHRVEGERRKAAHLYLFNDMLLVTAPALIGSKRRFKLGLLLDKVVIGSAESARFFTVCSPGWPGDKPAPESSSTTAVAASSSSSPAPKPSKSPRKATTVSVPDRKRSESQTASRFKRSASKAPAPAEDHKRSESQSVSRLKRSASKAQEPAAQSAAAAAASASAEEKGKEKKKEKKPKPMMPPGTFRLVFESASEEGAMEWVTKLRETQAAHVGKLESWERAKKTKGGAATGRSRGRCVVM